MEDNLFFSQVSNNDFLDICDLNETNEIEELILNMEDDIDNNNKNRYCPEVEDISDTELSQALVQYENSQNANDGNLHKRFKASKSDTEMKDLSRKRFSKATETKCKWAINLFNSWIEEQNCRAEMDTTISPIRVLFEEMTKDELNYSISRFISEIKRQDGEEFPPKTLYELVISLQLHLSTIGKPYKLIDDESFSELRNTLDTLMKEKTKVGLGMTVKKAQVITQAEEELLWKKNILGSENAKQLFHTLVYLLGLNFALRASKEHRNLRFSNSQLSLHTDSNGNSFLRYTEDFSKCFRGGIKDKNLKPKIVDAYENKVKPERCVVKLYQKYLSLCPKGKNRPDAFYLQPHKSPTDTLWYEASPVGINKLSKTVKIICDEAGLPGFHSNHSLRATAATRLYENFNEKVVCDTTGHRSNAVREYERSSEEIKQNTSKVLQLQSYSKQCPASLSVPVESSVQLKSNKNSGGSNTVREYERSSEEIKKNTSQVLQLQSNSKQSPVSLSAPEENSVELKSDKNSGGITFNLNFNIN